MGRIIVSTVLKALAYGSSTVGESQQSAIAPHHTHTKEIMESKNIDEIENDKPNNKQRVAVIPLGLFNLVLGIAVSTDGSLWFDDCNDGQAYHVFSLQVVKRKSITAFQFVFLWFRLIAGIA